MEIVALFGKNVRRLRGAKNLSQEELSYRCDMKRSYLSDLERGARNPSIRALGRLADALGVDPSLLLTEDFELPDNY